MEISDHMEISGHFGIRIVETMSNNELRDEDVSISGTDSSREDLGGDIAMGIESPSTSSVTSAPKEQNNSDNEEASVNDSFSVASNDSDTTASKSGVAKELLLAEIVRLYSARKNTTRNLRRYLISTARNLQLQNEIDCIKGKLHLSTQLLDATNAKAGALKDETQDLRKQLQGKKKVIEAQDSEIVGLVTTVEGLKGAVDDVRYELQLCDDLRTTAEHQLAGVGEEVQLLRQDNDRAQKEGSSKDAALNRLRLERDDLKKQLVDALQNYIRVLSK